MNRLSMFQSLARSIPENERKELLERINRSLALRNSLDDSIHRTRMPEEEREQLIRREIGLLGAVDRFILWILCLVRSQPKEKVFQSRKLNEVKKIIRRYDSAIIDFSTRTCRPRLGNHLFNLYEKVVPLIPVFKKIWSDGKLFEGMMLYLLGSKLKSPKNGTADIVPLDELKKIYIQSGRKEDIRNEILHRLDLYIQSIPDGVFVDLEQGLLPFYYFRELVFFPFGELFAAFQVTIEEGSLPVLHDFKAVSAGLIIDNLERLYYTMYVVQKVPPSMYFFQEIFDYWKSAHPEDTEDARQTVTRVKEKLRECQEAAGEFNREVPLPDLIRFIREDPYYRMMFYLPNLKLRVFYHSVLTLKVSAEFGTVFSTIRHSVVDDLIQDVFRGQPIDELRYYKNYPDFHWHRHGLRFFSHIFTMRVLYTYLVRVFRQYTRSVLEALSRKLAPGNRELHNDILGLCTTMDDLVEKVRRFDFSLAPEADDGKSFARLRYSFENDRSQLKSWEILIAQKDKEAKELIENGFERLEKLLEGIDHARILVHHMTLKKTAAETSSTYPALETRLSEQKEEISRFRKLLQEVRSLELHG